MTVKLTKTNQNMAFVTLEDLYGTVEIILFPRDYQKYRELLVMDRGLYVKGRASVSEENGKMVAGIGSAMDDLPAEIWIQVENIGYFQQKQNMLYEVIRSAPGNRELVIYSRQEKAVKRIIIQNISWIFRGFGAIKRNFWYKKCKAYGEEY